MKYSLSFTAGALLIEESRVAAQILIESTDATEARRRLLEQRLIPARTDSAAKRIVLEVLSRLAFIPEAGLNLVAYGTMEEARQVLWISCCRKYPVIRTFAETILIDASRTPGMVIDSRVVEVFFLNEEMSNSQLAAVSVSTKYKLRQVLKLMLAQAGLINDNGVLVRGLVQPKVADWLERTPEDRVLLGGLRA